MCIGFAELCKTEKRKIQYEKMSQAGIVPATPSFAISCIKRLGNKPTDDNWFGLGFFNVTNLCAVTSMTGIFTHSFTDISVICEGIKMCKRTEKVGPAGLPHHRHFVRFFKVPV